MIMVLERNFTYGYRRQGLAISMLTMMGIKANALDFNIKSAIAEVTKHIASSPSRISKIEIDLSFPDDIFKRNRKILVHTSNTCSVHYSLHPDIEKVITFNWEL